jgi:hypothetical protein
MFTYICLGTNDLGRAIRFYVPLSRTQSAGNYGMPSDLRVIKLMPALDRLTWRIPCMAIAKPNGSRTRYFPRSCVPPLVSERTAASSPARVESF